MSPGGSRALNLKRLPCYMEFRKQLGTTSLMQKRKKKKVTCCRGGKTGGRQKPNSRVFPVADSVFKLLLGCTMKEDNQKKSAQISSSQ